MGLLPFIKLKVRERKGKKIRKKSKSDRPAKIKKMTIGDNRSSSQPFRKEKSLA
jgi:hypothetical protein